MTETPDRLAAVLWCAWCQHELTDAEALFVWSRREPPRTWYVHRPTLDGRCFALAVGSAAVHGIAPASDELARKATLK